MMGTLAVILMMISRVPVMSSQMLYSPPSSCIGNHVRPRLIIIGCQKGGTSSLFADLASSVANGPSVDTANELRPEARHVNTACHGRHDPKECNVFATQSTMTTLYREFGERFCRPRSLTVNYCTRLRARPPETSSYFFNLYDACSERTTSMSSWCRAQVVNTSTDASDAKKKELHCVPLAPTDASPTYSTRPHVCDS